jgi:hypothetical protein
MDNDVGGEGKLRMDNGELIIENARGRVLGYLVVSVIPAQAGIQARFCG